VAVSIALVFITTPAQTAAAPMVTILPPVVAIITSSVAVGAISPTQVAPVAHAPPVAFEVIVAALEKRQKKNKKIKLKENFLQPNIRYINKFFFRKARPVFIKSIGSIKKHHRQTFIFFTVNLVKLKM